MNSAIVLNTIEKNVEKIAKEKNDYVQDPKFERGEKSK